MSRPITTQARLLAAHNWIQINRLKDAEVRSVLVYHAYSRNYRPPVIALDWDAFLRIARAQAKPPLAKIETHHAEGKCQYIDISFVADGMEINTMISGNRLDKLPSEINEILAMLAPEQPKALPGPKQARLPLLLS